MNFSELPPSQAWTPLKFRGRACAEVWFKPEGEPSGLTFRIPRETFQLLRLGQRLTAGILLAAVGIAPDEVASCRHEGASEVDESPIAVGQPLPTPLPGVSHLTLHVSLKLPPSPAATDVLGAAMVTEEKWQDLEARWNAVLGMEASIETLRLGMDALRADLEAAWKHTLTGDDKIHALNADVAAWTKAKSRIIHALPKAREFVHRAIWATGSPDRKKLEELLKNHVRPRIPFPAIDHVADLLDGLLKERQVLLAHGATIQQDCKAIVADVQGALRTLRRNAAAKAAKIRATASVRRKRR